MAVNRNVYTTLNFYYACSSSFVCFAVNDFISFRRRLPFVHCGRMLRDRFAGRNPMILFTILYVIHTFTGCMYKKKFVCLMTSHMNKNSWEISLAGGKFDIWCKWFKEHFISAFFCNFHTKKKQELCRFIYKLPL